MAPKTPKATSDRPYGLSENEVNVALHACKLLAEDGKLDKEKLAKLTGHAKTHSAYCIWNNIKNKMFAASDAASTSARSTSTSSPTTPTSGKKRGRPSKKKDVAASILGSEADEDVEGENPSPLKRTKMEETHDEQDPDGVV